MTVWYRWPDFEPQIGEVVQTGVYYKHSGMLGDGGGPGWARKYLSGGVWSSPVYLNHILGGGTPPSNLYSPSEMAPQGWRRIPCN